MGIRKVGNELIQWKVGFHNYLFRIIISHKHLKTEKGLGEEISFLTPKQKQSYVYRPQHRTTLLNLAHFNQQ